VNIIIALLSLAFLGLSTFFSEGSSRYFEVSPKAGIAPLEVTLNAEALKDSKKAETFIWEFGDGQKLTTSSPIIKHTFNTAGTFSVKLQYLKNKQDKIKNAKDGGQVRIVVSPRPNILPIPQLSCVSNVVNKLECDSSGSTDSDGTIVSYKFDWGDNSTNDLTSVGIVSHQYQSAGEKTVRLTVTDNKGGSAFVEKSFLLKTNTAPVANFSCTKTGIQKIHCESTSSDNEENISNFSWILDDGAVYNTASFDHTFTRSQDVAIAFHNVSLKVTDALGLENMLVKDVEVDLEVIREAPRGYFKAFIDGTTVDLRAFIARTQFNIKRATYQIYDAQNNLLHTLPISNFYQNHSTKINLGSYGNYRVNFTIVDYRDQQVTISRQIPLVEDTTTLQPFVSFRAIQSNIRTLYLNLNLSFDYDENYSIREFVVNLGNGETKTLTTDTFLTYVYSQAGTYNVSVTAKTNHGTERTFSQQVVITDNEVAPVMPDPTFAYRIYSFAQNVSFYNEKSGTPNGEIISYHWDFGDNTTATGETQAHFYMPGEYLVKLTVVDTAGYSNTQTQKIVIAAEGDDIVANIDCNQRQPYLDITQMCKVNALDKYNEINRIRVVWGDGTVFNNLLTPFDPRQGIYYPQKAYTIEGTYPVRLIVNTARGVFKTHDITHTVTARRPVANIQCDVNNLFVNCHALGSFDPKGTPLTYEFNLGNGHSESNSTGIVAYAYSDAGLYDVSVKVIDAQGMFSIATTKVQAVRPPNILPFADFNCDSPEPLTLYCWDNGISDQDGIIVSKKLTFDDGDYGFLNSENATRKQFATEGQHEITLTVIDNDGGVTTLIKSFEVKRNNPPIIAELNCYSNYPHTVDCYINAFDSDPSDIITSYKWEMGESEKVESTVPNIVNYKYLTSGQKLIRVTVADKYGKTATLEKNIDVKHNTEPVANFYCEESSADTLKCSAGAYDPDGDILTYEWKIDGESILGGSVVEYTFTSGLNHLIELTVKDSFGSSASKSESFTLTLNKKPTFDWAITYQTNTIPVSILFEIKNAIDEDGTIEKIEWDLGDGNFSEKNSLVHSYSQEGVYKVRAKVIDDKGGYSVKEFDIRTDIFENITITPDASSGFVPLMVNFESSVSDDQGEIVSYQWSHEGNIVGNEDTLQYEIDNSSEQFVRLQVTNNQGVTYFRDSNLINVIPDISNCPTPPTEIQTQLAVDIEFDEATKIYTYNYEFTNGQNSSLSVGLFLIALDESPLEINGPERWLGDYNVFDAKAKYVGWMTASNSILPSESKNGFSIKSPNPPGTVKFYSMGDSEVPQAVSSSRNPEGDPMCPGFFFGEPNGLGKFVNGVTQGPVSSEIVSLEGSLVKEINSKRKISKTKLSNKRSLSSVASINSNNINEVLKLSQFMPKFSNELYVYNGLMMIPKTENEVKFNKILRVPSKGVVNIAVEKSDKFDLSKVPLNKITFGPNKVHPLFLKEVNTDVGKKQLMLTFQSEKLGIKCNVDRFLFLESKIKMKTLSIPVAIEPQKCTRKHLSFEVKSNDIIK